MFDIEQGTLEAHCSAAPRARCGEPHFGFVPPADSQWANPLRWRLLFPTPWKKEEHINVLEAQTIINFARHLARNRANHGNNILVSTDSMV